jgi:hypothetical protein
MRLAKYPNDEAPRSALREQYCGPDGPRAF